ncbi:MAG: septal ring lytic transglycosylase RlpA family protein [Desulfovibrionaceae bacterium]
MTHKSITVLTKPPQKMSWRLLPLLIALIGALILSGCGAKKSWRKGGTPGTKPYTVRGKTYYPLKSAHGFVEEGVASWYGPGFHGKSTANGERYNQYAMTAAHKILPLGTTVTVTNLSNRRSITVRINDRGPFVGDRVIDLSKEGAERIGMIGKGTARVRVQSQGTIPNIRDDGDIDGNFFIQVGAFAVQENAEKMVRELQAKGFSARSVRRENNDLWNVQVGPWTDLFSAEKLLPRFIRDFKGAFVVGD